jgi:hypothetical protein
LETANEVELTGHLLPFTPFEFARPVCRIAVRVSDAMPAKFPIVDKWETD